MKNSNLFVVVLLAIIPFLLGNDIAISKLHPNTVKVKDTTKLERLTFPNASYVNLLIIEQPKYVVPGKVNVIDVSIKIGKRKYKNQDQFCFRVKVPEGLEVKEIIVHRPQKMRIKTQEHLTYSFNLHIKSDSGYKWLVAVSDEILVIDNTTKSPTEIDLSILLDVPKEHPLSEFKMGYSFTPHGSDYFTGANKIETEGIKFQKAALQ